MDEKHKSPVMPPENGSSPRRGGMSPARGATNAETRAINGVANAEPTRAVGVAERPRPTRTTAARQLNGKRARHGARQADQRKPEGFVQAWRTRGAAWRIRAVVALLMAFILMCWTPSVSAALYRQGIIDAADAIGFTAFADSVAETVSEGIADTLAGSSNSSGEGSGLSASQGATLINTSVQAVQAGYTDPEVAIQTAANISAQQTAAGAAFITNSVEAAAESGSKNLIVQGLNTQAASDWSGVQYIYLHPYDTSQGKILQDRSYKDPSATPNEAWLKFSGFTSSTVTVPSGKNTFTTPTTVGRYENKDASQNRIGNFGQYVWIGFDGSMGADETVESGADATFDDAYKYDYKNQAYTGTLTLPTYKLNTETYTAETGKSAITDAISDPWWVMGHRFNSWFWAGDITNDMHNGEANMASSTAKLESVNIPAGTSLTNFQNHLFGLYSPVAYNVGWYSDTTENAIGNSLFSVYWGPITVSENDSSTGAAGTISWNYTFSGGERNYVRIPTAAQFAATTLGASSLFTFGSSSPFVWADVGVDYAAALNPAVFPGSGFTVDANGKPTSTTSTIPLYTVMKQDTGTAADPMRDPAFSGSSFYRENESTGEVLDRVNLRPYMELTYVANTGKAKEKGKNYSDKHDYALVQANSNGSFVVGENTSEMKNEALAKETNTWVLDMFEKTPSSFSTEALMYDFIYGTLC